MKVHVHIDRLIVDGLDLEAPVTPHLERAIRKELARRLVARPLSSVSLVPRAEASTEAPPILATAAPKLLGARIGESLSRALSAGGETAGATHAPGRAWASTRGGASR